MHEHDVLAQRFESHRGHLRTVAYRMLGSLSEADDAIQEAWLRLSRADASEVGNLGGWLTTVVARLCLDVLRSRKAQGEEPWGFHLPDPIVERDDGSDPERGAVLADSVSLALLVVLETLPPAERLAFVLHDLFGMPFEEIAPIVDRTPTAARQLASRARRRVQGAAPRSDADLAGQRAVLDAFVAAVRAQDLNGLLAVLHPDVVLRTDRGASSASKVLRGAREVAGGAMLFARLADHSQRVLINGSIGYVGRNPNGRPFSIMSFTIVGGRVVEMHALTDPERLARLELSALQAP